MEAVASLAGEVKTDHPATTCPVLAAFVRAWNDALPDPRREELLRPLLPALVGSRADADTARRRSIAILDWLLRRNLPAWLELADHDLAAAYRALPPVRTVRPRRAMGTPVECPFPPFGGLDAGSRAHLRIITFVSRTLASSGTWAAELIAVEYAVPPFGYDFAWALARDAALSVAARLPAASVAGTAPHLQFARRVAAIARMLQSDCQQLLASLASPTPVRGLRRAVSAGEWHVPSPRRTGSGHADA